MKCDPKWGREREGGMQSPGYGHLRRPHPELISVASNKAGMLLTELWCGGIVLYCLHAEVDDYDEGEDYYQQDG